MEWLRPAGIVPAYLLAKHFGTDAGSSFHILGPLVVIVMSGTVAFESLINFELRVLDLDPGLIIIYHGVNEEGAQLKAELFGAFLIDRQLLNSAR